MNFGTDFLRNIGISNIGDPGTGWTLNGPGNQYPLIGTGSHVYAVAGYLIPAGIFTDEDAFQPYVDAHLIFLDAYEDVGPTLGAGVNYFMHGHHAKWTLHYRARPVFVVDGQTEGALNSLHSEILLQLMVYL
ncbi:MAG: hypothetical protein HC923_07950 [Myxococcales bacterium]|nr:hypothetical protein [Myxococcales bacterium]